MEKSTIIAIIAAVIVCLAVWLICRMKMNGGTGKEKTAMELAKEMLLSGADSARGTVIARKAAGNSHYVLLLLENGGRVWAKSETLYKKTALGDNGTVTYRGNIVLDFVPEGSLEMKNIRAVVEAKGYDTADPGDKYRVRLRSDAFEVYGGILNLKCSAKDYQHCKAGDSGEVTISGGRLQSFEAAQSDASEYKGEKKSGPEQEAGGWVVFREKLEHEKSAGSNTGGAVGEAVGGIVGAVIGAAVGAALDSGPNIYYNSHNRYYTYNVVFLLDNGQVVVSDDEKVYDSTVLWDRGRVRYEEKKLRSFKREDAIGLENCPAVLVGKMTRRPNYSVNEIKELTFFLGEYAIWGEVSVQCTEEEYNRFKQTDVGSLSFRGGRLLSFEPRG